ncbi:hypothetical protein [Streptococcus himalayensis]|uniref:Uncharacterized protein n=1 Tax=Streptococcus himalayensis TaxID=1888195 RepID=A0A917EEF5_9STRE|nr:hypothetical protein [Streptococcus himalayensis]GGE25334.1 hypothetical protein GCM10011510_03030 [Streptococcus himalayensis]
MVVLFQILRFVGLIGIVIFIWLLIRYKKLGNRKYIKLAGIGEVISCTLFFSSLFFYSNFITEIPYSSEQFVGRHKDEVVKELEKAGFTNIKLKPDKSLKKDSDEKRTVSSVVVGNQEKYQDKANFDKNIKIVIAYHEFLDSYAKIGKISENVSVKELEGRLKSLGFNEITLMQEIVKTGDNSRNGSVKEVSINGQEYYSVYHKSNYFPKDSKINITYYEKDKDAITVPELKISGPYTELENKLKELGFTNIKLEPIEIITDINDYEVKYVTIEGHKYESETLSNHFYTKDTEIVIGYNDYSFYQEKKRTAEKEKLEPSSYGTVSYDAWNHDEVAKGTKVQVAGEIVQVSRGLVDVTLRIRVDDSWNIIYATVPRGYFDSNILAEDDKVTVYGTATGLTTYETIFGAEKTLPSMTIVFYTRH